MKEIEKVVFKTPRKQINALVTEMNALRAKVEELTQERDDYKTAAMTTLVTMSEQLAALEAENAELRSAAQHLIKAKGRYHSEQAYKRLVEVVNKIDAAKEAQS